MQALKIVAAASVAFLVASPATAQELDVTHGFARMRGVITDSTDLDYFKVTAIKSELNVALFSRSEGAMSLTIEDASGAVLAT